MMMYTKTDGGLGAGLSGLLGLLRLDQLEDRLQPFAFARQFAVGLVDLLDDRRALSITVIDGIGRLLLDEEPGADIDEAVPGIDQRSGRVQRIG